MPAERGLFVSVDGPSGVGKSTTVALLGDWLTGAAIPHQLTAEPTAGPIGALTRNPAGMDGATLACLYAADRYAHLTEVIRPAVNRGEVVVTDRYVPSALVMQQLDGVPGRHIRAVNALADPPDIAVILTAHPEAITARLHERGTRNRYSERADTTSRELAHYSDVADYLTETGVYVLRLDTTTVPPVDAVAAIGREISLLRTAPPRPTRAWMKETA